MEPQGSAEHTLRNTVLEQQLDTDLKEKLNIVSLLEFYSIVSYVIFL